jgi:predicted PurR-regulated permease PerM
LERWRVPPVPSVIVVVGFAFLVLGCVGLIVATQVVSLAESLPKYRENITQRFLTLRGEEGGVFDQAAQTLFQIQKGIAKTPLTPKPNTTDLGAQPKMQGGTPPTAPIPVEVQAKPPATGEILKDYVSPALIPLARLGLAVVLVIFFLLQREDLGDRLIRILSRDRLDVTTRALNDAGNRIGQYLRTQLLINTCYGVLIGIGLALMGLPGAVLWGLLATLLRFIPYVRPWLAASMPILYYRWRCSMAGSGPWRWWPCSSY